MNTVQERLRTVALCFSVDKADEMGNNEKINATFNLQELLDFIHSEIAQAKLEVVEEIERWLNKNADTNDCNGSRQLSPYYLEKLEHKLTELKSTLGERK